MKSEKQYIFWISIIKSPKYIEDNKLVIITEVKTIYFDVPKKCDRSLKHEIDFII